MPFVSRANDRPLVTHGVQSGDVDMDSGVISSGALFRAMLQDNGRDLSFGDDWDRLLEVIDVELARTDD